MRRVRPLAGRALARRDWLPDVAHAHFWLSGLAAVHAGRRTGVPVVLTYHALGTAQRRLPGRTGHRPTGPGRLRARARPGRRPGCRAVPGRGRRAGPPRRAPVPDVSGARRGQPADRSARHGPVAARDPARPRVLTVGRLVERKGFEDVVRAMPLVPDAECVVVGGPPAEKLPDRRLRPAAARARRVLRGGRPGQAGRRRCPREEMARWYRSADLLVAAPWYEPFGLTAAGGAWPAVCRWSARPSAASPTPSSTGSTGDLVPPRDPRALGAAIRRLLGDTVRRFAYATAALDRIRSRTRGGAAPSSSTSCTRRLPPSPGRPRRRPDDRRPAHRPPLTTRR